MSHSSAMTFSTDGQETFTVYRDGRESIDLTVEDAQKLAEVLPVWLAEVRPCDPGCEWEPGHRSEHPCGKREVVLAEDGSEWVEAPPNEYEVVVGADDPGSSRIPEDFFTSVAADALDDTILNPHKPCDWCTDTSPCETHTPIFTAVGHDAIDAAYRRGWNDRCREADLDKTDGQIENAPPDQVA